MPIKEPKIMSKPWCLKSEKRVDETYKGIDIVMSGRMNRYVGGAAACLRRGTNVLRAEVTTSSLESS